MTRTWKIAALVGAAFVVLCAVVAFAIHWFGANDVEAFAGVWSFIAVALAAVATIIYVRETSDMASAARESAKEQARVATLMEGDLRVRIAPHLRYEPLGGTNPTAQNGRVRNAGLGMAASIKGFGIVAGNRIPLQRLSPQLEPRHDHVEEVWFSTETRPTEYSVLLTCTDSLNLTDYSFEWNQWGILLRYSAEPHSDGSSGEK